MCGHYGGRPTRVERTTTTAQQHHSPVYTTSDVWFFRLPTVESLELVRRDRISWTPDGSGVAFARDGNLWVQATEGGAPRPLTRFTDTRPIGSFAWSRDGTRLAITRVTVTNDIVLFRGLGRE